MASWITDIASDELLRTWVRQCPALKLATSVDGRILFANQSFLEWSQYRLSEITRLTIDELNGVGGLANDIGELETQSAVVQRIQLRPNGEASQWGHLTRMRYPLSGNMECFLCTWEPIKPATAEAFALALEHSVRVDAKLGEMTSEIRKLTHQTNEENWVLSSFRIMQSHPKIAMMFLIVALSVMGLNNVVGLLQRMGVVSLPVKIEKVQTNAAYDYDIAFMGYHGKGEASEFIGGMVDQQTSGIIADGGTTPTIEFTTPNGTAYSVSLDGSSHRAGLHGTGNQSSERNRRGRDSGQGSGIRGTGTTTLPVGPSLHRAIY